jgi:hypothetical protein
MPDRIRNNSADVIGTAAGSPSPETEIRTITLTVPSAELNATVITVLLSNLSIGD